jgi:lysophospholipid acyltransferase (LPLAT)-like uncharacterized protein
VQAAAAGLLGATLIRALGATFRTRILHRGALHPARYGAAAIDELRGADKPPLLFALWHGPCIPILTHWRGRGLCVVTSRSADGQILAGILRRLGYQTVSGSSTRGGTRALINLARFVQKGGDAAIAVDGPRGPALCVKPGIILLAKITGRPIVPLAASAKRFWQFQSWDRFRLPFPFTRTVITGDEPVHVPPDAGHDLIERKRLELEGKMLELQRAADAFVKPKIWRFRDRKR